MRGREAEDGGLFSYLSLEKRVPMDHPLRAIRSLADAALAKLSGRFDALYSTTGRPSIAPEMLLRATLPATATIIGVVVLRQIPSALEVLGVALVMIGVAVHKPAPS